MAGRVGDAVRVRAARWRGGSLSAGCGVGRVGALAVALGVGAVVGWVPGVAAADEGSSGASEMRSSGPTKSGERGGAGSPSSHAGESPSSSVSPRFVRRGGLTGSADGSPSGPDSVGGEQGSAMGGGGESVGDRVSSRVRAFAGSGEPQATGRLRWSRGRRRWLQRCRWWPRRRCRRWVLEVAVGCPMRSPGRRRRWRAGRPVLEWRLSERHPRRLVLPLRRTLLWPTPWWGRHRREQSLIQSLI